MNAKIRLLRKPVTTSLWLILCAAVSAFLLMGISLWYSTGQLSRTLSESHTAIAVRTDQSIVGEPRYFTQADKEWFEGLDSVKAVCSHTLSAAVSPSFSPLVEISRFNSYRSMGNPLPYCHTVLLGEVYQKEVSQGILYVKFWLGDILLLGDEYVRGEIEQVLHYQRQFSVAVNLAADETAGDFFEKGNAYIVCGYLDPETHFSRTRDYLVTDSRAPGHMLLYTGFAVRDGEILRGYVPSFKEEADGSRSVYETYSFPAAQCLGPAEEFIEGWEPGDDVMDEAVWGDFRAAWEKQQHSLPVIGTDRLESLYAFLTGRCSLLEGRSFTQEEYEQGAKVLILSEKEASMQGLKVGDTVRLSQYVPAYEEPGGIGSALVKQRAGYPRNNPVIDMLNTEQTYGAEEEFTLVGIYSMLGEWSRGTYDFTPNTVFIPRKAQTAGAVGEIPAEAGGDDLYGLQLSIELVNGRVNEFMLELDKSPYKGQFYPFDQGYEDVQKSINDMAASMTRLLVMSVLAFLLFLVLYLLMFQGAERKTLGTMRSLGVTPRSAAAYLFGGGFAVAALGTVLGTAAGGLITRIAQDRILAEALANIDRTVRMRGQVITEEALTKMVQDSGLSVGKLALLGLAELLLISVLLFAQARVLARRDPRKLTEG